MDGYMDEKWKLTKKGSMNATSSGSSGMGMGGSKMRRSSSCRRGGNEGLLRRSESVPANSSFSKKCSSLVKEQRAKFYIVRRCVTMLVCWRKYRDT